MPTIPISEVIQQLRSVVQSEEVDLTDGQLLERFVRCREPFALEELVRRHAPMVWGVCRRVLRDHHDAEDAFQATFLVLVRKAAAIRSPARVGNWLYGVAHQTALKAGATRAKRKARERPVTDMHEPAATDQGLWSDLLPLLDHELSRLPEKYRTVLVLCELEGKTGREAARHLDLPQGTVASRLARARAMLAKRLAQRGVVLSGGALAAVLSQSVASAVVPPLVVSSAIKAASLLAAGQAAGVVTAKVAALADGVVKAMFTTKIKSVLALLVFGLILCGIGAGVGLSTHSAAVAQQPEAKPDDGKNNDDKAALAGLQPKQDGKAGKEERKVLTPEEAIKQMPKENVTVQFKVASVQAMPNPGSGFGGPVYYIFLHDGGKFTARLAKAADQFMKLGIEPVKHFTGNVVRVTGRVEADSGKPSFQMWVRDLADIEVVKE